MRSHRIRLLLKSARVDRQEGDGRAIRFPRLSAAAERLKAEVAALSLPAGVRVLLPKDLASDELRIELRAKSGAELMRQIEALGKSAAHLKRISGLLGGEGEL